MQTGQVLLYDLHLPDVVDVYAIASASIRRYDDIAFVCDLVMPEGIEGAITHSPTAGGRQTS